MPSARPEAPGELALIERFVNDMRASTADELAQWFAENRLGPGRWLSAAAADLTNAVALREAFRSLLASNNGAPPDVAALACINEALVRCTVRPLVDGGNDLGFATSATAVDGILGRYLCAMLTALAEGSWGRLKVCANEDCRWAFFDRSRNHAGTWCEMATCGNLFKARRHRARKRIASTAEQVDRR